MNNIKLQTLVNVMYNEVTKMDYHKGTFIQLYNTNKDEAIEVINTFIEAFPFYQKLKYLCFNTNKNYCLVRVHSPGHTEKYPEELIQNFSYLYIDEALEDFNDIAYNTGYSNENGIKVKGEIIDNDEKLDGGDFIGQFIGIFKTDNFYFIAGITKESPDDKDEIYPITCIDGKYVCNKDIIIEKFKNKPLKNTRLKYDKKYDYEYNSGNFIIEEYVHKFNRTHCTQIVKYQAIDTSD